MVKGKDSQSGYGRLGQRDVHPPEDTKSSAPIDSCRVLIILGDGQKELPEQEDPEHAHHMGDDQTAVRVDPI